uniref:DUF4939 domain-containing protein n=1 Tax=Oryzias latipes TaxID=8090 RepID=A0A3P9JI09_ORYLA
EDAPETERRKAPAMPNELAQTPDPADPEGLRHAVNQQRAFLELHSNAISRMSKIQEDLLSRLNGMMQKLTDLPGQMSNSVTTATLPTSGNTSTNPPVPTPENFRLQPEPFYGDLEACSGFLLQCQLLFHQAPRYYSSDPSKITLIVNSLRNKALQWAQAFLATLVKLKPCPNGNHRPRAKNYSNFWASPIFIGASLEIIAPLLLRSLNSHPLLNPSSGTPPLKPPSTNLRNCLFPPPS